jgi:ferrous iron transport protein A
MMEKAGIHPLSLLRAGQKGTVIALTGGREFQSRLVSMGLNVGCDLEVVHSGNGRGGPTLVATGESRIAVGHGMLDRIQIAVDPE